MHAASAPTFPLIRAPMSNDITRLLIDVREGQDNAVQALLPFVYTELQAMAHRQLGRHAASPTLNTTGLVHEAYLRLVDQEQATYNDRQHFFAVSAMAMRQIIVDYARKRRADKRGGGAAHTLLDDDVHASALRIEAQADEILALDQALTQLAAMDERLAKVVEMRFFGGLSVEETAQTLGVSTPTVKRDTRVARAFLARALSEDA